MESNIEVRLENEQDKNSENRLLLVYDFLLNLDDAENKNDESGLNN